jgi:TRAP-type C4-dicarboxylate transport system substrate-binding protein
MRTGAIQGFGFPDVMAGTLGIHKYVKYRVIPGFYRTNIVVTMNLSRWKTLSKKTQNLINKIAIEYESASIDYVENQRLKDDQILRDAGVVDLKLSDKASRKFLTVAHDALWRELERRSSYADRLRAKLYVPFQ